jgi:hypothetical protein
MRSQRTTSPAGGRRRAAWALLALALAAAAWFAIRRDRPGRSAPAKPAPPRTAARNSTAPAADRLPAWPRWTTPDGPPADPATLDAAAEQDVEIARFGVSGGIHGVAYPSRTRVRPGAPVDLVLDLFDGEGRRIEGRRNIEGLLRVVPLDTTGATGLETETRKVFMGELPEQPGHYSSPLPTYDLTLAPGSALELSLLVPEAADPNQAGAVIAVHLRVVYGADAWLDGAHLPQGTYTAAGLEVAVPIGVEHPGAGAVRAQLLDELGQVLAEATTEGTLAPPLTSLRLVFDGVTPGPSAPQLGDLTLWADSTSSGQREWVDFSSQPRPVIITEP